MESFSDYRLLTAALLAGIILIVIDWYKRKRDGS